MQVREKFGKIFLFHSQEDTASNESIGVRSLYVHQVLVYTHNYLLLLGYQKILFQIGLTLVSTTCIYVEDIPWCALTKGSRFSDFHKYTLYPIPNHFFCLVLTILKLFQTHFKSYDSTSKRNKTTMADTR